MHSRGMNHPVGGYERCKHVQSIDHRPTRAETLTEKTLNFVSSTRVRTREDEKESISINQPVKVC